MDGLIVRAFSSAYAPAFAVDGLPGGGALIPYETGSIEVMIELGIGRQASEGIWDSSAFDYAVWGQDDTSLGDWVDVTCDVSEITLTGGADAPDGVVTAIRATTGGLTLHGDEWNPWASPWGDMLGPDVAVRIRWRHAGDTTWLPMFYGVTDGWPYDRDTKIAAVPILDATGYLANLKLGELGMPVGNGESVSARIGRVLDAARWPAARRDIPSDRALQVAATVLGDMAWSLVATAADTDLGLVFCTRAGLVTYRPVAQLGQWSPVILTPHLTDEDTGAPDDLCVVNYTRADPQVVRNDVTIARAANPSVANDTPVPYHATNDGSVQRFGSKTYERTDLIHASDSWSQTVASVILDNDSFPAPHPQTAELDVRTDFRVADLLLSGEVSQAIHARDGGNEFLCIIVGYNVALTRAGLSGALILQDVTAWQAGGWDSALWDEGRWGV
jgi:hypothetical protein